MVPIPNIASYFSKAGTPKQNERLKLTHLLKLSNIESLSHLFYFCPNSKQLWTQLENKIKISTQFTVNFIPCDVLLGYTLDNNNSIAINVILLVTKAHINKSSRILKKYYIKDVIQLVERTYNEQHLAAKLDYKEHKFERKWHLVT